MRLEIVNMRRHLVLILVSYISSDGSDYHPMEINKFRFHAVKVSHIHCTQKYYTCMQHYMCICCMYICLTSTGTRLRWYHNKINTTSTYISHPYIHVHVASLCLLVPSATCMYSTYVGLLTCYV